MSATTVARHLAGTIDRTAAKFRDSVTATKEASVRVTYMGPAVDRYAEAYPTIEFEVIEAVRTAVGNDPLYLDAARTMVNSAAWYVLTSTMSESAAFRSAYARLGINRTAIPSVGHGPTAEENYRALGGYLAALPSQYRNYKLGGYGAGGAPRATQSGRIQLAWGAFINHVVRGF